MSGPRGKPFRIIYALSFRLDNGAAVTLALNRNGQAAPSRANDRKNGMPHWPKKRTVDLRIGDSMYFRGAWHRIRAIRAARSAWLTAQDARQCHEPGYIYRPRNPR